MHVHTVLQVWKVCLELHSFFPPPLHMIQAHLEQYIRISWKLSVE